MKRKLSMLVLACFILASVCVTPAAAVEEVKYGRHPNLVERNCSFVTDGEYAYYMYFGYLDEYDNEVPFKILKEPLTGGTPSVIYQSSSSTCPDTVLNYMDGWLYFSDGFYEPKIYKVRSDGTDLTLLRTTYVADMLIVDDRLYYTAGGGTLMSIDLNGLDLQCHYDGPVRVAGITAYGRKLYMTWDGTVVCYDINHDRITTFAIKGLEGYHVSGLTAQISAAGRLYFVDGAATIGKTWDTLYSMELDGSNPKIEHLYGYFYIIVEDQVYYWDDGHIYKVPLSGRGTPTRVTNTHSGNVSKSFTYHNGYIYTFSFDENPPFSQIVNFYKVNESISLRPISEAFSDVSAEAYYARPVEWALKNGITSGTSKTTFSPHQTCTTAQILTFLWAAQGRPEPSISNPFHDVKGGEYYENAALWAYEKGLISSNTFGAGNPCTRSATVTYLWKLAGSPFVSGATFKDVPKRAEFANAVSWAVKNGITNGTGDNTFSPDMICTRGQIMTFLYKQFGQ